MAFTGLTRNISACGTLFTTETRLFLGDHIEYVITLPQGELRAVHIRCSGTVVRVEPGAHAGAEGFHDYWIAVTVVRHAFA